jgi:DEAD/DEAH box helicase
LLLLQTTGGGGTGGGGDRLSNLGQGLSQIDFTKVTDLVPFEKDFYLEHPDVSARSEAQADAWRASKGIQVRNCGAGDVPKPVFTFEEASMPEYVLNEVLKCGFDTPTPIQSQGWPMALKGKNMVGVSATGSGKTLAFLLPGMIHINAQVRLMIDIYYMSYISYIYIYYIYTCCVCCCCLLLLYARSYDVRSVMVLTTPIRSLWCVVTDRRRSLFQNSFSLVFFFFLFHDRRVACYMSKSMDDGGAEKQSI